MFRVYQGNPLGYSQPIITYYCMNFLGLTSMVLPRWSFTFSFDKVPEVPISDKFFHLVFEGWAFVSGVVVVAMILTIFVHIGVYYYGISLGAGWGLPIMPLPEYVTCGHWEVCSWYIRPVSILVVMFLGICCGALSISIFFVVVMLTLVWALYFLMSSTLMKLAARCLNSFMLAGEFMHTSSTNGLTLRAVVRKRSI